MNKPIHSINQRRRIKFLRAAAILIIPITLFAKPSYFEGALFTETIEFLGLFLILAAIMGRLWAILYIGGHKNNTVIQDGPYSIMRHPLYFFSILASVGFGLMLSSLVLAVLFGCIVAVILSTTAKYEEGFLMQKFGEDYNQYALATPMIMPQLSSYRSGDTISVSIKPLKSNFCDTALFLLFIPCAEIIEWARASSLAPFSLTVY